MWENQTVPEKIVFDIVECSPKAKSKFDESLMMTGDIEPMYKLAKYPLSLLKIGQSFIVPFSAKCSRRTLEASKRFYGFRTGKEFTIITHSDLQLFEVARIG